MNLQTRALLAAATALLASPACASMGETTTRVDLSTAIHLATRGDERAIATIVESTGALLGEMDDARLSGSPEWEIASLALDGVEG